ncbi:hypothetical protein APHAL10511_005172 [Amanita phalloides]|nr:hypothetical protein APHAL10511_005172 [Amanita phalloides]
MVNGKAIATLALFILSIISVIQPVKIPIGRRRHFPLNLLTMPLIVIGILWASQCLGASTIRRGIVGVDGVKPYNILILFFSLAYMSITLDVTGILKAAAYWVSNMSGSNGTKLFIYFYLLITVLSGVFGNDPLILSGTLFLVYYTNAAQLDNLPWLMSEFAAANTASMILFVGNPTNVVICEGFRIDNAAFTAWTFFPFLACSSTCLVVLFLQYRLTGKLQPKLSKAQTFRARKAINDLPGAIIGTVLLCSCLVTALVVSFRGVDVWKITLPFAGTKFIFDICWDVYRVQIKGSDRIQADIDTSLPQNNHEPEWSDTSLENSQLTHGSLSRTLTLHYDSKAPGAKQNGVLSGNPSPQSSENQSPDPPWWESIPYMSRVVDYTKYHLPTLYNAFPRLPFALVPFAFSQFILIEALDRQGWISIFARWLVIATRKEMYPTLWIIGVTGVILCNISGTNIGATILLTKVVRAANLPFDSNRAAGVALAVASNIGAVSFVFSASLAGLLWKGIIDDQKAGSGITQRVFAKWNMLPLVVMMGAGLAVGNVFIMIIQLTNDTGKECATTWRNTCCHHFITLDLNNNLIWCTCLRAPRIVVLLPSIGCVVLLIF